MAALGGGGGSVLGCLGGGGGGPGGLWGARCGCVWGGCVRAVGALVSGGGVMGGPGGEGCWGLGGGGRGLLPPGPPPTAPSLGRGVMGVPVPPQSLPSQTSVQGTGVPGLVHHRGPPRPLRHPRPQAGESGGGFVGGGTDNGRAVHPILTPPTPAMLQVCEIIESPLFLKLNPMTKHTDVSFGGGGGQGPPVWVWAPPKHIFLRFLSLPSCPSAFLSPSLISSTERYLSAGGGGGEGGNGAGEGKWGWGGSWHRGGGCRGVWEAPGMP